MKIVKKSAKKVAKSSEAPKAKYKDLREVMDYTRNLAIFFSGVENESYLSILYDVGVRNFLMSYHYLNGRPLRSVLSKYDGAKLFIDSGAYTYTNDPKFSD